MGSLLVVWSWLRSLPVTRPELQCNPSREHHQAVEQLVSAISRPFAAYPLRDMAQFVTERRARRAQSAALNATFAMKTAIVESLDPRVGRNLDRRL